MLKKRILTAIVLITLVTIAIFILTPIAFTFVTAAVMIYAVWEYSKLVGFNTVTESNRYLLIVLCAFAVSTTLPPKTILLISFCWWLLVIVWLIQYQRVQTISSSLLRASTGLLVLIPCWVAINEIRLSAGGKSFLLFLLILVWVTDISAYFIGRRWGKRPLASVISPHKSIEGVCGALVAAFITSILGCVILQIGLRHWPTFIFISMLTTFFAVIGDLFESMLKRQQNLKDTGKILPGHGGLLDRIDSLTAAAPAFALGAIMLGYIL